MGAVLIILLGIVTNYTAKKIVGCLYLHPDPSHGRIASYAEIGRAAFGTFGAYWVHVFQKGTFLGAGALFLILGGQFLMEGIGGNTNCRDCIVFSYPPP